jgi:hypothetical protein
MARVRNRRAAALAFDAITVEGSLISPAMLGRIAKHDAGGQSEADYAIPKGLTLRDEIARYFRIGQALFAQLAASQTPSLNATISFVEELLRDVFGFKDIKRVGVRTLGDRQFAVTLEGLGGRVPVVVVPPGEGLDRPSVNLTVDGRRRSAASAIQDWVNANSNAAWGLCCNGLALRLVRDNASLTRPAYIEADLERMFEDEAFADFTALWLLLHATRFGQPGTPALGCALERWREAGQKEGVTARENLREGVEAALLSLGNGFLAHADNSALRDKVHTGALPLPEFFGQLLRLVYRLIFLLAAEDRNLLHPPGASAATRRLYAEGYSVGSLRDRAVRRAAWDRHHDRWEGMLIAFAGLASGEPRLGLPALGGIFAQGTIPDLETVKIANRSLMDALYRLAWLKEDSGLVPVNWRDMETEELGSVYEGLLELTPQLADDGRRFNFAEGGEAKGHARKMSGSYYTPDSLVQALLDSALDPVLDRVEAEASDPSLALLSVTVLDPACGSGHFLLAAARRIATRLARARAGGIPSAADFRHALRDVARACLYGVDRNPMAVELTKVAIWIETVDPGKPLGFLDANIRCGDSLFGVFDLAALAIGIPDATYKPLAGDDKETARYFDKRNKSERHGQGALDFAAGKSGLPAAAPIAGEVKAVRSMPEDSPEQIAAKRRRFESALADPRRWNLRVAADLYVAAFLAPKTGRLPANHNKVTIPTTGHVWAALANDSLYGPLVARAQELAGAARAFHWPLEFPDIMTGAGFDAVLGNPPWERIKLQEQEFFASREPEIAAAPNAARRGKMITALKQAASGTRQRALYEEFQGAKRASEASSVLARLAAEDGGRFPLAGRGDVNTYALFTELFGDLTSSRGRAGAIVPTGVVTDSTTAPLFTTLLGDKKLIRVVAFENEEFIFPNVHHSFRFCLMTIGYNKDARDPEFFFFLRRIEHLYEAERRFTLSSQDIGRINPNTRTAPLFRTQFDAELTTKIYARIPVLVDEAKGAAGNLWNLSFMAMFHMSNDSELFRTASNLSEEGYVREGSDWIAPRGMSPLQSALDLAGGRDTTTLTLGGGSVARERDRYAPLYEAKMASFFDHRAASYARRGNERGHRVLPPTSCQEHSSVKYEVEPFYWVPTNEVNSRLREKQWHHGWLLGWKDITTAVAERTLVPLLVPRCGCGDTILLMFPQRDPIISGVLLAANLASLVTDYVARQKISYLHLKYNIFQQLAVLPPSAYIDGDIGFISRRVLELSYTSHSMTSFARDLGYRDPPFTWNDDRRAQLRAELDAWYARAYGLTRDELRYILDPVDVKGADYPSETFRVLKKNEIARFGEYRTARLVLAAWDAMERGELAA